MERRKCIHLTNEECELVSRGRFDSLNDSCSAYRDGQPLGSDGIDLDTRMRS